jgi:hypothetical protein
MNITLARRLFNVKPKHAAIFVTRIELNKINRLDGLSEPITDVSLLNTHLKLPHKSYIQHKSLFLGPLRMECLDKGVGRNALQKYRKVCERERLL